MLTLENRFINVSMSLPKTSYVKMVDVWLLFTLLIPFLEVCFRIRHTCKHPSHVKTSHI